MRTKLCFIATVVLMVLSVSVFAQEGGKGGKGGKRGGMDSAQVIKEVDQLAKDLSLSADQKSKVQTIKLTQFNEMKAQMKSGSRPDQATMKAAREKEEKELAAVLTADQKTKYAALQKKRQQNKPQGGEGQGGEPKE